MCAARVDSHEESINMGLCTDYRGQLEASMQDELCDAGFYA